MRHDAHSREAKPMEHLGVLTRSGQMRILNCSVTGCLLETSLRLDVGTIASIRVLINGREFVDDVKIVRCQAIAGAGSTYHIGAQFLWTQPPDQRSLRSALWQSPIAMRADVD